MVQEGRERAASAAAAREAERRRRQAAEKNAEQRQQEASRAVDEQAFRTLLAEAVKDPGRTWREARARFPPGLLHLRMCCCALWPSRPFGDFAAVVGWLNWWASCHSSPGWRHAGSAALTFQVSLLSSLLAGLCPALLPSGRFRPMVPRPCFHLTLKEA